jgi:hypothetical protein
MRTKCVLVLAAIGCVGTVQAAQKIRYEEIPGRIAAHSGGAVVFTTDGTKHAAAGFRVEPDRVVLYRKDGTHEDLPSEHISRIEIKHRRGRFFGFTVSRARDVAGGPLFLCGKDRVCLALAAAIISPIAIALTAGSAPVTLAMDGVTLFIQPRVYEIVH